jgi:hypothetical protein
MGVREDGEENLRRMAEDSKKKMWKKKMYKISKNL